MTAKRVGSVGLTRPGSKAPTRPQVANDPNLTAVGKREHLEPLHQQVTEQMSALRDREKAAVKAEKEKLERHPRTGDVIAQRLGLA